MGYRRSRRTATTLISSGVAVVVLLILMLTTLTRVEPGYEGVKVHLLGSSRGVNVEPLDVGRHWYFPITHDIYRFPVFLQRVVWTQNNTEGSPSNDSFTFRSREGYSFNVDVGFGFSFQQGSGPRLFERYRRSAAEIIVREAFVQAGSQMEGLDILGAGVTALNDSVTALVRGELDDELTLRLCQHRRAAARGRARRDLHQRRHPGDPARE